MLLANIRFLRTLLIFEHSVQISLPQKVHTFPSPPSFFLRQLFPLLQLESTLNLNGEEVYARHHAMMDMMLKNRLGGIFSQILLAKFQKNIFF